MTAIYAYWLGLAVGMVAGAVAWARYERSLPVTLAINATVAAAGGLVVSLVLS